MASPPKNSSITAKQKRSSLIYILEGGETQETLLTQALVEHDYVVQSFTNIDLLLETAQRDGNKEIIEAIIIKAIFSSNGDFNALTPLITFCKENDISSVISSSCKDLTIRLNAIRLGVDHFLCDPCTLKDIHKLLGNFDEHQINDPYRVLFVDDDKDTLFLYDAIVSSVGIDVKTLLDPFAILDAIESFSPDVIVLDMHMPKVEGTELAKLLRDSGVQQPILFLSGETDESLQLKALKFGGDDFIVKPVTPDYLVEAINARAQRSRQNSIINNRLEKTLYEREREHLTLNQHAIVTIADGKGNITYANEKFCQISGYSLDEIIGKNHRIIKSNLHSSEFYKEMWRTITNGHVWHGELCNRAKNGDLYWVESTITPFLDDNGKPYQYVSIRTDITHVKKNAKILRGKEARLNFMMSSTPVTIYTCEATPPFAATWISPNVKEQMGYEADQFTNDGSFWAEHIHPDDKQEIFDSLPQLFDNGLHQHEYRFRISDGSYIWMQDELKLIYDESGKATEIIGFWNNINAKKIASDELRVQKERLRHGQIFANIGTWDWDIQTGDLFWSERIAPLFGYEQGDLETSYDNFLGAVHPEDRDAVINAVNSCVEDDEPYDIEHRVLWPDGTVRWLHERGAVMRDEAGTPLKMLGVVQDIDERRRAQNALLESQQKLKGLFELSPLGIALTDMSGKYIEFNEAFREICGYPNKELKELDYWKLTPSEYAQQEATQLEMLEKTGGYGPYEKEYRRKNGSLVPVRLNGIVVQDHNNDECIWSIVENITDSKLATAELNRFKTTLDMTKDCVFMFEPASLKFFYANQGALNDVGYTDTELMNMHPYDLKPLISESQFREIIKPLVTGEIELLTFETIHQHKSGSHIPVEISLQYIEPEGESARYVAIVRNITERKVLQEQMERHKRLLDALHESTTDFVSKGDFHSTMDTMLDTLLELTDSEYGFVGEVHYEDSKPYLKTHAITNIAWNDETQKLYNEFSEKGFEFRRLDTLFGQVMTTKKAVLSNNPHTDPRSGGLPEGHPEMHSFLGVPIIYAGELIGMYGIANRPGGYDKDVKNFLRVFDSTYGVMIHSKRMSEVEIQNHIELVSAKESAEQANRAKSEFLSSMSHELRTPLNAILGFSQLIELDNDLIEDHKDSIQEILKAGHHLLNLINEVLDLAKIESGHIDLSMEPVLVYEVIEECLALVEPLAKKRNITINHSYVKGISVRADHTRLKQALLNLLSNAIKYNRDGGEIFIKTSTLNDRVRILVTDTGKGIAEDRIAELFQPFNRLDSENTNIEGTGIGLSITQRIIEMMGGTVDIHSDVGVGSTFWIELPIEAITTIELDSSDNHYEEDKLTTPSILSQHTILYIEDNPANLKLVSQILNRRKHINLVTAHLPHIGIELARQKQPELILLDINMPEMDGYQVLEIFKNDPQLKNVPVIAITAKAMSKDIKRGKKAGFTDYITKPIDVANFLKIIDNCQQK